MVYYNSFTESIEWTIFIKKAIHNFRHMKQHEQEEYVDFSKMSESEVIMHHFKQFDHDKDGKLDGLEVLKQIQKQNGKLKNIDLDV